VGRLVVLGRIAWKKGRRKCMCCQNIFNFYLDPSMTPVLDDAQTNHWVDCPSPLHRRKEDSKNKLFVYIVEHGI